jgi:hypothetical protein
MTNAPVLVPVLDVVFVIDMALVVVAPLPVTVCKVLVFQTVTAPVLLVIAVSVPAVILVIAKDDTVAVVMIRAPAI